MVRLSIQAAHEQVNPTDLLNDVVTMDEYAIERCWTSDHYMPWWDDELIKIISVPIFLSAFYMDTPLFLLSMSGERISRRTFLRLSIFFIFFLVFGLSRVFVPWNFSTNRSSSNGSSSYSSYNSVAAQTAGTWTVGPSTSAVAIHATLLYTGKIFYLTGSGYNLANQFGPYIAKVFDPSNGTESTVSLTEDLFCAGHTQLSNGNILLAGGNEDV
jgi:hypothetical protein